MLLQTARSFAVRGKRCAPTVWRWDCWYSERARHKTEGDRLSWNKRKSVNSLLLLSNVFIVDWRLRCAVLIMQAVLYVVSAFDSTVELSMTWGDLIHSPRTIWVATTHTGGDWLDEEPLALLHFTKCFYSTIFTTLANLNFINETCP